MILSWKAAQRQAVGGFGLGAAQVDPTSWGQTLQAQLRAWGGQKAVQAATGKDEREREREREREIQTETSPGQRDF